MTKKNKTPLGIFTEAVGLYFSNFKQFAKYMAFPVFGQVFGLVIIFGCALIYSKNLPYLIQNYQIFNDFNTLVLFSILVSLPGLIIFLKAFWEYLVAYGAINSMLENMLKSGKVYDFNAHTELIKRRTASFVTLWLILGIFSILAICPLFWVPAGIVAIYLTLVFQVFTFEPELSPVGCIKKSFNLIKGHFASTFMLICLSGLLCWILIPQTFEHILEFLKINSVLNLIALPLLDVLPISDLNNLLAQYQITAIEIGTITGLIVSSTVGQILIQFTLPLRSLLCGLWYKELNGALPAQVEKKRSSKKRLSENLMEETHKKFTGRLDKNILRRASEKED